MPLVTKTFSDIITFTRTSGATYFDSNGVLQTAGNNVPRLDYNPSTLAARGLLIEEARTNSIRNNTMQGAVAGTPGTAPTNWSIPTPSGGLSAQVIGTGTENGVTYIDVRYSGTATGTAIVLSFDTSTQIAALNGQNWTGSLWIKNITSTFDNYNLRISLRDSGGAALASIDTLIVPTTTLARFSGSGTLANASVAFVQPQLRLGISVGVAYDVTIRIGLPQLEQGAFATSVIPTTTTALTRSADVASVNTLSPWYNASASTLYTEFNTPVPVAVAGSAVVVGYDDGTANNRFSNFYTSSTGAVAANQVTGGAPNYTIAAASGLTLSNIQKQATRFQAGSYASSANGAAVVSDSFASAPPTVNTLRFGLRPSGTQANMWLRRVTVYPRGLSNAELQAITA